MAAGAYKGLTIRIGADTTKFTSALRSVNSVAFKTQSELNKLTKAARIDPGNVTVATRQLGVLGEKAIAVQNQFETMNQGIKSLGDVNLKNSSGTVAEMSERMKAFGESSIVAAEATKQAYNQVDAELERVYKDIREMTNGEVDIRQVTNEGNFNQEYLDSLRDSLKITQDQYEAIMKLKPAWTEARNAMEDAANVAQYDKMVNDAATYEATLASVNRELAKADRFKSFKGIGDSLQPINNQLTVIGNAASMTATRFEKLDKATKLNPTSINAAAERFKALREAVGLSEQKIDLLKQKLSAYEAVGIDKVADSFDSVEKEVTEAEAAFAKATAELDKLIESGVDTGEEFDRMSQAADEAQQRMDTAHACQQYRNLQTATVEEEAKLRSLGDTADSEMQRVGTAAVNAAREVGQLMQQLGQNIIQASTDVDSAYRDMRKTVDGTEEQYAELYDAAMRYSQTHVTSADQMLEMEAIAGQVGITADALQNFAEVAANLDVATDIQADEIALKMGQIVNVMSDLNESNVQGFADALVDLGNNMPAQESAIMQIAQRLSSVGDVAGFTTPQILGWAASIASTGQRSEAAATGISNTITSIQSAVSAGGEDLDAFASMVNMSADEFKKSWGEDASGTLRMFVENIKNLGPDAIAELEKLGITGVRQTQTLLGLAKTVENVDKAIGMSQKAWDGFIDGSTGAGAAAEEAQKKAEGFSGSMAKLKNSAQILAASLGPSLIPFIDAATEVLQRLITFIDSLPSSTKSAAVGVGTLLAAFATVEPIVSALTGHFSKLGGNVLKNLIKGLGETKAYVETTGNVFDIMDDQIGNIGSSISGAIGSVKSFGGVIMALGESGVIAAGAVGALAAVVAGILISDFINARKHAEEFNASIDGINSATEDLGREMYLGSDAVAQYADEWSAARVNMDEYLSKLQEHNAKNAETRSEMGETIGLLSKYQEILDGAVGKGDAYTGSVGELQWALDGLNEITGESWSVQDVLKGKYEDETGAVHDLTTEIDQLVEARKREARTNAIEQMLTENYKAQMENEQAIRASSDAYKDHIDLMLENRKYLSDDSYLKNMSNTEYIKWLQENDEHTKGLIQDNKELRETGRELDEQEEELTHTLEGLVNTEAHASGEMYGFRESVIRLNESMMESLEAAGVTDEGIKKLSRGMNEAGVSAEDFARISNEQFAQMVEKSGGDINALLGEIISFNAQKFDDKYANVSYNGEWMVDAEGDRVEWNNATSQWEKVNVEVDTSGVDQGISDAEQKAENADVTVTETVEADTSQADAQIEQSKQQAEGSDPVITPEVDTGEVAAQTEQAVEGANAKVTPEVDDTGTQALTQQLQAAGNVTVNLDMGDAKENLDELAKDRTVNLSVATDEASMQAAASAISNAMAGTSASGKASVDTSSAMSSIDALNRKLSSVPKNTNVNVSAKVSGKDKVDALTNSLKAVAKRWGASLNVSVSGREAVNSILFTLSQANGRHYSTTYDIYRVTHVSTKNEGKSATGGYFDPNNIPRHAAGIFTRPTLTNIGWVGEDGAELYSGNSLVPLTNRKYSMPYIDDISDAVAKKLGPVNSGNQITVTVTGVSSPDEVADAIARKFQILNL